MYYKEVLCEGLFYFRNCGLYFIEYRRFICLKETYKTFCNLTEYIFINEIERNIKSHKNCHKDCKHNHLVRVFKHIVNQAKLKDAKKRSVKRIKTKPYICKILYTGNLCKEFVEHRRNFSLTTEQNRKNDEVCIVHHNKPIAAGIGVERHYTNLQNVSKAFCFYANIIKSYV